MRLSAAEIRHEAALIAQFLKSADSTLERFVRPPLRNWNGIVVGELRPARALSG